MSKPYVPRCLITGASGFVGANVLKYALEKTDWEFTCLASWRHHGNPLRVPRDPRVEVITHDLTAPIPDIGYFDVIWNLASESHVDRSIKEPVSFIENNVSSTLHVLEYARNNLRRMFVQFSTDEVYGTTDHSGWDVLVPSNPYAASKAAQEMICIAYWRTYGVPVVITNSNNIVGPDQDPEKYVPMLIRRITAGENVCVHMTPNGPGRRYYNPVQNVADALLFISEYGYPERYPNTDRPDRYSIPGGAELDNLEMAQLVADLLGMPLHYTLQDADDVRPGYDEFYPKTDNGLTDEGWKPPMTLQEGLSWITSP